MALSARTAKVSFVLATYNDENSLEATVLATLKELPQLYGDYEIIIANDGSRDRTGAIAD